MSNQTRKIYFQKTLISNTSNLKIKAFEIIQKAFNNSNFLHYQNLNQQLYIDLNVSKWHGFDVMMYCMKDDLDKLLDYIIKEN